MNQKHNQFDRTKSYTREFFSKNQLKLLRKEQV